MHIRDTHFALIVLELGLERDKSFAFMEDQKFCFPKRVHIARGAHEEERHCAYDMRQSIAK